MSRTRKPAPLLAITIALALATPPAAHAQVAVREDGRRIDCESLARRLLPLSPDSGVATASVVLRAAVRAKTVRFARNPRVRVVADECPGIDSVRVVERRNLPEPIEPGVVYRDVYIVVEIFGHARIRCRPLRGDVEPRALDELPCPAPRGGG